MAFGLIQGTANIVRRTAGGTSTGLGAAALALVIPGLQPLAGLFIAMGYLGGATYGSVESLVKLSSPEMAERIEAGYEQLRANSRTAYRDVVKWVRDNDPH